MHVDGTARPQLVRKATNPCFHRILEEYRKLTGIRTVINTSFNMHEEPIVCTPEDAIRAFLLGHLDCLALGPFIAKHPEADARVRARDPARQRPDRSMCGICGQVRRAARPRPSVGRMVAALRHRGPDDAWHPPAGLLRGGASATRALASSTSRRATSPIANEDRRLWVILNGEIYNYREPARGAHRPRTSTSRPAATPR